MARGVQDKFEALVQTLIPPKKIEGEILSLTNNK
jgi:hypothetical protein